MRRRVTARTRANGKPPRVILASDCFCDGEDRNPQLVHSRAKTSGWNGSRGPERALLSQPAPRFAPGSRADCWLRSAVNAIFVVMFNGLKPSSRAGVVFATRANLDEPPTLT